MISRANKFCKFYPCHEGLEDCTFCYCPLYPCGNQLRGEYVYSIKFKKNIWSCEHCNWIHKKKTVDNIFKIIRKNKRRIDADTKRNNKQD
ncbi:MAG: cysteine-rich small domain-containing protein [bacterium]